MWKINGSISLSHTHNPPVAYIWRFNVCRYSCTPSPDTKCRCEACLASWDQYSYVLTLITINIQTLTIKIGWILFDRHKLDITLGCSLNACSPFSSLLCASFEKKHFNRHIIFDVCYVLKYMFINYPTRLYIIFRCKGYDQITLLRAFCNGISSYFLLEDSLMVYVYSYNWYRWMDFF